MEKMPLDIQNLLRRYFRYICWVLGVQIPSPQVWWRLDVL